MLKRLDDQFTAGWFPLANNVEKLSNGTEKAGLGQTILQGQPGNVIHAQASSYLGVVLEDLGLATWNRLTARGESPSAFDERCILAACVAPPSNTGGILGRRALTARRFTRLGATPDFHHGLLSTGIQWRLIRKPPSAEGLARLIARRISADGDGYCHSGVEST